MMSHVHLWYDLNTTDCNLIVTFLDWVLAAGNQNPLSFRVMLAGDQCGFAWILQILALVSSFAMVFIFNICCYFTSVFLFNMLIVWIIFSIPSLINQLIWEFLKRRARVSHLHRRLANSNTHAWWRWRLRPNQWFWFCQVHILTYSSHLPI